MMTLKKERKRTYAQSHAQNKYISEHIDTRERASERESMDSTVFEIMKYLKYQRLFKYQIL